MSDKARSGVRFNLYIPRDELADVEALSKRSGKRSIAETVRAALAFYRVVCEAAKAGKDLYLIDPANGDRERLVNF